MLTWVLYDIAKDQLHVEYVLNAPATIIDAHTVEVAGKRFNTRNLVLATGARTLLPDMPGLDQKGVYDFATLLSDLDYEPSRCVIVGGSKVAIEYDGEEFHTSDEDKRADAERRDWLRRHGWTVIVVDKNSFSDEAIALWSEAIRTALADAQRPPRRWDARS